MLGQPLDFTPGTQAVYSNFGYMLLGLVIERASGEPYAQAAQSLTLGPMGITGLANGAARDPRFYLPGEARRYGPAGEVAPGGLLGPAMFASGAWIGSTVDLVRFLSAVDGSRIAPILSPALTQRMLSGDPSGVGSRPGGAAFGMGWDTVRTTPRGILFEKNGGVLGTMTWIEHRPGDVDWAMFFNRSEPEALRPEMHELFVDGTRREIERVTRWPEVDYFRELR
jgi:N-acyl-D-amino-acid deacylase